MVNLSVAVLQPVHKVCQPWINILFCIIEKTDGPKLCVNLPCRKIYKRHVVAATSGRHFICTRVHFLAIIFGSQEWRSLNGCCAKAKCTMSEHKSTRNNKTMLNSCGKFRYLCRYFPTGFRMKIIHLQRWHTYNGPKCVQFKASIPNRFTASIKEIEASR